VLRPNQGVAGSGEQRIEVVLTQRTQQQGVTEQCRLRVKFRHGQIALIFKGI
jgi:hypothetical protein